MVWDFCKLKKNYIQDKNKFVVALLKQLFRKKQKIKKLDFHLKILDEKMAKKHNNLNITKILKKY